METEFEKTLKETPKIDEEYVLPEMNKKDYYRFNTKGYFKNRPKHSDGSFVIDFDETLYKCTYDKTIFPFRDLLLRVEPDTLKEKFKIELDNQNVTTAPLVGESKQVVANFNYKKFKSNDLEEEFDSGRIYLKLIPKDNDSKFPYNKIQFMYIQKDIVLPRKKWEKKLTVKYTYNHSIRIKGLKVVFKRELLESFWNSLIKDFNIKMNDKKNSFIYDDLAEKIIKKHPDVIPVKTTRTTDYYFMLKKTLNELTEEEEKKDTEKIKEIEKKYEDEIERNKDDVFFMLGSYFDGYFDYINKNKKVKITDENKEELKKETSKKIIRATKL